MNPQRLFAIAASIGIMAVIRPAFAQEGILKANDPQAQINLRESPDLNSRRLGYGAVGDRVEILQQSKDSPETWYRVRFRDSGAVGWIRADFVTVEADRSVTSRSEAADSLSADDLTRVNRATSGATAEGATAEGATEGSSNSSSNPYQEGYDRGYQYGYRDGQNAQRYNAGYHPDKILRAGSGSSDANYDRGFRAGFFDGFEVGYNGETAPEPTPVTDGTILTFQTRDYAVRIFGRYAQTLMNIYDKRKGATWLNGVPVEIEQVPNGLYYDYETEAVRAFQGADGSRSLEINGKVEAAQPQ